MSLVERIRTLAKEKGTTIKALERELGIGNGTIRGWDQSSPSAVKLLAVATFLDTSTDYLLTGSTYIPQKFASLINKYTLLPAKDRIRIDEYMQFVIDCEKIHTDNENTQKNFMMKESSCTAKSSVRVPILGSIGNWIIIMDKEKESHSAIDIGPFNMADFALSATLLMEPIVKEGEYVFVKKCDSLQSGEIGIFTLANTFMCAKFYRYDDHVELQSMPAEDIPKKYHTTNYPFPVYGKIVLTKEQLSRI